MKFVLISDLHLHNFQQFNRPTEDGMNSRLAHTLNAVEQGLKYASDNGIQNVFILGDVFHAHSKLDVDVIFHAYELFESYCDLSLIFLVGNHDQAAKDGSIHSLKMFDRLGIVAQYGKSFAFCEHDGTEINVLALSYRRDEEIWKKSIPKCKYDIFLGHQGINEGKIGAFNISLKGNISLSDLPDARFRLLGHYHKHQKLDDRTWYVGSPLQHNFGERGETKGFVVLDTIENTVTQIETDSPKFHQFDSVAAYEASGVDPKRDYVKIVLGTDEDVEIDGVQIVHTNKNKGTDVVEQPQHFDDTALMKDYIERENSELSVEKLLQLGQTILEGVEDE